MPFSNSHKIQKYDFKAKNDLGNVPSQLSPSPSSCSSSNLIACSVCVYGGGDGDGDCIAYVNDPFIALSIYLVIRLASSIGLVFYVRAAWSTVNKFIMLKTTLITQYDCITMRWANRGNLSWPLLDLGPLTMCHWIICDFWHGRLVSDRSSPYESIGMYKRLKLI